MAKVIIDDGDDEQEKTFKHSLKREYKDYHRFHRSFSVDVNFYGLGVALSAGITWFVSNQDVWRTIWHGLLSWLYFGYWLAQTLS
ncbi:MAG: hypothetical protein LBM27_01150 [Lactobacillaceae bacterium]|jgi:hypothetical protein|nr:hypothetical protein [Lactobacillaceae bacterium]